MSVLIVKSVQVTRMEFVLLWATYLAIMYTDLERGIGAGVVMATLYFAYSYAQARPSSFFSLAVLSRRYTWHQCMTPTLILHRSKC